MVNVTKFVKEHTSLCVCTFGLAVLGYLGYQTVRWIVDKCRSTEKINIVAQKNIPITPGKQDSLSEKKIVELPAEEKYLSQWESLGIQWVHPLKNKSVLASAVLPEGWELRMNLSYYSDHINATLLDTNHIPRVNVFIKTAYYDYYATAHFLTEEESKSQFEEEIESENIKRKKEEETKIVRDLVISKRFETWSEEHPFAVFFVKDMSREVRGGYVTESKRNSCHGFFSTEEVANKAKELLEESSDYSDTVFMQKLSSSDLNMFKKFNVKTVNGFIDPHWCGYFTW